MSVNESLWGDKSTWVQYRDSNTDITDTLISNSQTLESINGNVSQSPNIDLSCSPWGIGGGSWLCNTFVGSAWIQTVGDNPYNKPLGYATQYYNCDKNAGKQHPMILLSNQDITGAKRNKESVVMYSQNRYYPDANADAPSYLGKQPITHDAGRDGYALKPILQFNYKNLILIPYVIAYNGAVYHQILLDDFCNNTADITKTDNIAGWREQGIHITGIGYKFAFGDAGSRNSSTDDQNEIFNIATIRSLTPYDIKDTSTINQPPPMGNIPQDAYYVTISSCQNLSGNDVVLSTMLSNTNASREIVMYRDVNAQPFTYWYDGRAQDTNQPYNQQAVCYMTGGDNFTYETHLYWSTDIPAYHDTALRYMYLDITDLSDDDVRTELWRQVAYLGFVFTKDHTQINGVVGMDSNLCMPVFANGVTTGDYKQGEDVLTLPNFLWTTDVFDKNEYNPYDDGGGGGEQDKGDLSNIVPRRYGTSGTKKFVCDAAKINALQNYLNGSYIPDNAQLIQDFKGTNPQDYIVSVQKYPIPLPTLMTTQANIVLGRVDTELTAIPLETDLLPAQKQFDFGAINISAYGDFRDYLTKITLMMPFIGSVDLDPKLYIGHTIGLIYDIDYDTGSVAAEIKRDGLTLETKTGTISISVPFFAANMGAYQSTIAQTSFAIEQSKIKQIAGIMSTALSIGGALATGGGSDTTQVGIAGGLIGGVSSMLSGQVQQQSLQYELEHTVPSIGTLSVAAAANAFLLDDRARLIIVRPKMLPDYDPASYSRTVGNACARAGKLSSFSGYTVAAAAKLDNVQARDNSGVAPTAQELNMIRKLLQSGVYND